MAIVRLPIELDKAELPSIRVEITRPLPEAVDIELTVLARPPDCSLR